jgi:PAS domain S-box-containing protein
MTTSNASPPGPPHPPSTSAGRAEPEVAARELEQRIAERTAELAAANAALQVQVETNERAALILARRSTELEETKHFLDSIIDYLPIGLFVKDARTFKYLYWNHAAEEQFGLRQEDVLGRDDHELFPEEVARRFREEDQELRTSARPFEITEENVPNQLKGLRVLHLRKAPILGADGSPRYVLGTSEDITERQQAEAARRQSEALFRALFENSPDAVLLIDPHDPDVSWPIVDCNAEAGRMNGYSREELIGQSIDILNLTRGTEAERAAYLNRLRAAGNLKLEAGHRRKDGVIIPVEISTSLITVGGRELVLGIDRDVTERKQAEETLRRQNVYLEALHETTLDLLGRLDLNSVLESLVSRAAQLMVTAHGYICLLNSQVENPVMELKVGTGLCRPEVGRRFPPGVGASGLAWQTAQPVVVNDYDNWPDRDAAFPRGVFQSLLAVPLTSDGRVNGILGLAYDSTAPRRIGDDDVEALTRFAQLASVALENARLIETERTARHQAETLQAATQAMSSVLDLRAVLEIILTKLKDVIPYDSASVQEIRHGQLQIVAGVGFPDWEAVRGLTFDISSDRTPNRDVISTRQPIILSDAAASRYPGFQHGPHMLNYIRSWMGVPLMFGSHAIGMLTLDKREPDFYTDAHARVVLAFAAQAAIAMNNARMYATVQEYADETAGLYHAATQLLNPGGDVAGLTQQIADAMTKEFAFSNCGVLLVDEQEQALRRMATAGDFAVAGVPALPLSGSGLTVMAAQAGRMVYAPDVLSDPHYLAGESRTRSELVMPLKAGERVIGVLDLQSPQSNAFDERAQRVIAAFAKHAELALENARLVANLEQAYRRLQDDQERLLAAEKMASLGRLTAGIAHEMNTPLAAVRSSLNEVSNLVAEYQAALGDPEITLDDHRAIALDMQKAIKLADTATERAAAFVRSIKAQTRDPGSKERVRFNAVAVIQDTLLILSHALRHAHCTASFEHPADDLSLIGSPGRLAQVVTNLVMNAIDASTAKGGGPIHIQLRPTAAGLDLQVRDSGIGIAPENLGRIFEPMFTTKPFGQGTGLGLSIVHAIVTGDFGGAIEVASQPDHGATFTIHFPTA